MLFKVLQMFARGCFMFLMALGFFYNSDCDDLNSLSHFVTAGVYGSSIFITLGLLAETSMNMYSDLIVERQLILMCFLMNVIVAGLAFHEHSSGTHASRQTMNTGFMSCAGSCIAITDLIIARFVRSDV